MADDVVGHELAIRRRSLASYCLRLDDGQFGTLRRALHARRFVQLWRNRRVGPGSIAAWFTTNQPPARRGKHLTLNSRSTSTMTTPR